MPSIPFLLERISKKIEESGRTKGRGFGQDSPGVVEEGGVGEHVVVRPPTPAKCGRAILGRTLCGYLG